MPNPIRRKDGLVELRFTKKGRKPKSFYFNPSEIPEDEIFETCVEMNKAYKKKLFNPWEDEVIFEDSSEFHSVASALSGYSEVMKSRYSEKTIDTYDCYVSDLQQFLGSTRDVQSVKKSELELWINRDGSHNTRKSRKVFATSFLKYMVEDGLYPRLHTLEASGGSAPKEWDYLTVDMLNELLEYGRNRARKIGYNTEYHPDVWYTVFHTGFRISEVERFLPGWFSNDMDYLSYGDDFYRPKKRRQEGIDILPVLDEAKEEFARMIHGKEPGQRVFTNGKSSAFRHAFDNAIKVVFPDIEHRITFHCLRKSFGMYLVEEKGLQPKELMEMMRHKSMDVTMKFYTKKNLTRLKEAVNS